jgi:hypothetical protein
MKSIFLKLIMKVQVKKTSKYYQYMESFFAKGDTLQIAQAKREYRKLYKREWKKNNKRKYKEVTIRMNTDEYKQIQDEAKRYSTKLAPFMKQSTIAYLQKTYLVPDTDTVNKILQLLKMMYIQVEDMVQEKGNGAEFLQTITQLETDIRIALLSPIDIEQAVKKFIEKNPV